jgi:prevent-host-death family protein
MEASMPREPNELPEPTQVGMRELRHDFRAWVERVRAGERVVVTDRGRPVINLTPHVSKRSRLQEMRDLGMVIPATITGRHRFPSPIGPVSTRGTDALRELREDRL